MAQDQPLDQPAQPIQPVQPTQPQQAPARKRVVKWDKGVDYLVMYQALTKALIRERRNNRCYAALALIVLRNGLRISEGVEAFKTAITTDASIVDVRTRKKKRTSFRKAKIPDKVRPILSQCRQLLAVDDQRLVWRFTKWLRKKYKINPHSLRYSFVTFAAIAGLDSTLIAKAIDHSRVDQLDAYVQKHAAVRHILENDLFEP